MSLTATNLEFQKQKESLTVASCKTISGLKTHPGGLGISKQQSLLGDHTCQHLVQACRGMIKVVFSRELELDQVKNQNCCGQVCHPSLLKGSWFPVPTPPMWEMGQADDWPSNSLNHQIMRSHIWSWQDHKAQLPL